MHVPGARGRSPDWHGPFAFQNKLHIHNAMSLCPFDAVVCRGKPFSAVQGTRARQPRQKRSTASSLGITAELTGDLSWLASDDDEEDEDDISV